MKDFIYDVEDVDQQLGVFFIINFKLLAIKICTLVKEPQPEEYIVTKSIVQRLITSRNYDSATGREVHTSQPVAESQFHECVDDHLILEEEQNKTRARV